MERKMIGEITRAIEILSIKMNLDRSLFDIVFDRDNEYPATAGLNIPKDGGKRRLIFNLCQIHEYKENIPVIVAHEMIHEQQHQLKKSEVKDRRMYWMGEDMTDRIDLLMFSLQIGMVNRDQYMSLPWEAEAYTMQYEVAKLIEE